MTRYRHGELQQAITAICPEIRARVAAGSPLRSERQAWWEMSACVLSSQVPYSVATAAADAIDRSGLLLQPAPSEDLNLALYDVLSAPVPVEGRQRTYRFPGLRAFQLSQISARVYASTGGLMPLLASFPNATTAREWLVKHAPGLGPKQASMFLRNIGMSYELAVLDRHVINYMNIAGLRELHPIANSLKRYRQDEDTLREHANEFACPVGILDWAIWIVMRVATERDMVLA